MRKRSKKPEGGASWMDTYGDMVTLLLCFFVMLYSISSVDQTKWENLVRSLNPNLEEKLSQIVTSEKAEEGTENTPVPGSNQAEIDQQFDELYDNLVELQQAAGNSENVQVAQGDGYQFITYKDNVFFNGDSHILREDGMHMLDQFCQIIGPLSGAIKEIQVLGHTSQADPNVPNEVVNDRMLSSERSAKVVSYIQMKNVIEPVKLVGAGYGQFRPIDTFATPEGRAKNRRVEILITKTGSVERTLEEYYDQVYTGAEADGAN